VRLCKCVVASGMFTTRLSRCYVGFFWWVSFARSFFGATKILYFFAVLGVLLDYTSYILSADALNRSKLVLAQYSPEVADRIRLLPPSFIFESLGEPYRILRYVVFHLRWRNL